MALQQFTATSARPLPVIILADTSGSMGVDGKIQALNLALNNMLNSFKQESRIKAEIQVSIVTFSGETANIYMPLKPVSDINQEIALGASGGTPLGDAIIKTIEMIEDKEVIPSRAYKPTLVLVSDGQPTDDWESAFEALKNSDRAKKATRMAMAIGQDADKEVLTAFINDVEAPLFEAHNAKDIQKFFRAVTMSVSTRTQSNNPNDTPKIDYNAGDSTGDDEFDEFLGGTIRY